MADILNKDSSRQTVLATAAVHTYLDVGAVAGTTQIVELPAGATVVGGYVECIAAFTGMTSPTITITGYATSGALTVGTGKALTPTGTATTATTQLDCVIGGTGTATAGSFRLIVEYVVDSRACEVQG